MADPKRRTPHDDAPKGRARQPAPRERPAEPGRHLRDPKTGDLTRREG